MASTRFEGIIPPVSTIFTEAGAFDPKGQALVIEKLIAAGVDGLFMCGTGGEFSQMSTAERKTVAEFAVKQAAGRAKVLVGVGSNNQREAVELAIHAESIGADGIVAVNPSYWKVTEPRLLNYFTDIAGTTKLPVLLYNIPFLTGQDLSPAFVKSVVEAAPNVVGIKETIDSIGHIREMINVVGAVQPGFQVLAGYDDHLLTTLMLGGAAASSRPAETFAPELSIGDLQSLPGRRFRQGRRAAQPPDPPSVDVRSRHALRERGQGGYAPHRPRHLHLLPAARRPAGRRQAGPPR